ncbi:DUF3108 domain-containing protein [Sphingomonas koreensis]
MDTIDPLSRRTLLALAAVAPTIATAASSAAPHRLNVGDRLARFDLLKPGRRSYLRSQVRGGAHVATDIWQREVRFERVDGVERLRIIQRWDGTGKEPTLVERDSLFEIDTFRPLTHVRTTRAGGKMVVEGFRFGAKALTGMRELADNSQAAVDVPFAEPMYNFEADIETLRTLPLARGYAVSIPFFHPVGGAPARYVWRVAAEEALAGPDGRGIDCWVVETDYNRPQSPPARFWFAKRTQQLIRQESLAPDGVMHMKTLLF